MALEIVPAQDVPLPEQARVFSDAFTGYVGGSFAMDSAGLARFICAQGAELCFSRFVRNAERLCGFGYITRTGDVARVSGMGVVPQARRQGVARKLLLHLIAEAKARGDRLMVLEVIDQNPAAHALYRSEGFRELTRLCGWRRAAGSAPNEAADNSIKLKEISAVAASQLPSALEFPDLPWQISRHAIRKLPAARAYSSGAGFVVLDDPGADRLMRVGRLQPSRAGR